MKNRRAYDLAVAVQEFDEVGFAIENVDGREYHNTWYSDGKREWKVREHENGALDFVQRVGQMRWVWWK